MWLLAAAGGAAGVNQGQWGTAGRTAPNSGAASGRSGTAHRRDQPKATKVHHHLSDRGRADEMSESWTGHSVEIAYRSTAFAVWGEVYSTGAGRNPRTR